MSADSSTHTGNQDTSAALAQTIRDAIAREEGSIGFDQFMSMALYEPGCGYYLCHRSPFGPDGDFVTAPDLSALFGATLARVVQPVLDALGGGDVVELGPGTGALCATLMRTLEEQACPPGRYWLVELNPSARQRQRAFLEDVLSPALFDRCFWLDEPPTSAEGVILGNETLDAQPCKLIELDDDRALVELRVGLGERGAFEWTRQLLEHASVASEPEAAAFDEARRVFADHGRYWATGYRFEVSPARAALCDVIGGTLTRGAVLLLDYGYGSQELYHPDRTMGTLRCCARHRRHDDPLRDPGLQDISAHADFSVVANRMEARGLRLAGYTTQTGLLLHAGVTDLLAAIEPGSDRYLREANRLKTLLLPGGMGEAVKAIMFVRGFESDASMFRQPDLRTRL